MNASEPQATVAPEVALKRAVIDLLGQIAEKRVLYRELNFRLRELQGDFCTQLQIMDDEIETFVVAILDRILSDSHMASYFLYEASSMKDGGVIYENDKRWRIKTVSDVEAYIFRSQT